MGAAYLSLRCSRMKKSSGLDVPSLTRLWSRVFLVLDEPLEVFVANQNFNSILQMDAFFGYMTV
ncbi:hypothetical protein A2U01_0104112, partial [Trifolium medium]|nr:hypothetical protein [Trifolium medium]